jgi:hypothetical protein
MSAAGSRSTLPYLTKPRRLCVLKQLSSQSSATSTHLARARVSRGSMPNDRKIVAIARGRRHCFGLGG